MEFPEYPSASAAPLPARGRILAVAHDVFMARGFHRITMDELAADLGMSKKTLYQHFDSKAALLDAVLDLRIASIRADLEAVLHGPSPGFAARLGAAFQVLHRRLSEVRPPFMQDLRRHAPDAFRRIERFRREFVGECFGRLLADGRRERMVRRDLDDRIVIEALLTLIQTLVTPEAVHRLDLTVATAFDNVLKLVLEGVLTERGRKAVPGEPGQSRRRHTR